PPALPWIYRRRLFAGRRHSCRGGMHSETHCAAGESQRVWRGVRRSVCCHPAAESVRRSWLSQWCDKKLKELQALLEGLDNKLIERAIKHRLGIAGLGTGAQILDA